MMIEALSMVAAMVLQADASEGKEKEGLPLLTTRRIEFETDEATWLSLDVSPDGHLLLEIAGDLYTLDRIWPSPKKLQPFGWWTSSTNSLGGGRD